MADQLAIEDAFCFICQSILIEPVRLPCRHVFCIKCFDKAMEEASYSCPLCRRRVSNWLRTSRKPGGLVDKGLWARIQKQFHIEVQTKLSGGDDGLHDLLRNESNNFPVISGAGEIAKEYNSFLLNHEEEVKMKREQEERKSLQLIAKLQEEEKTRQELEKTHQAEEKMSEDLIKMIQEEEENERREQERKSIELIKILQEEDKKATTRRASSIGLRPRRTRRHSQLCEKKKSGSRSGPMDQYIRHALPPEKQVRVPSRAEHNSDSRDSIAGELNSHFKPIRCVPKTPPKTNTAVFHPHKRTPSARKSFDFEPQAPYCLIQSSWSAFLPKKTDCVLKEINFDDNSDDAAVKCGVQPQPSLGAENQSVLETTSSG